MTATQAAGNVALDPQFKEMVADPSNADLGGLLFDLVKIGLSVLGVKAAVDAYKAAKIAAAGKAAAGEAIADLEKFKRSIKGANLDDAAKERLIAEAERQFAKQPKLLLHAAEQAEKELVALHAAGSDAAKVRIARIVDKYASDAYTKTFLELQESGRILTLDEAGLRSLKVPQSTLDGYLHKYVTGPNASKGRGFVHQGPPRVIFIKPGSEADVSQTVVHELVHELQKSTGTKVAGRWLSFTTRNIRHSWSSSDSSFGCATAKVSASFQRNRGGCSTRPRSASPRRSTTGMRGWRR